MSASADRSRWSAHAREQLSDRGHRSGGARLAVLSVLEDQDCCLTAQEIHDELRDQDRVVGLASVYRTLELLAGMGLVHRIGLDQAAAYEPALVSGEHHHHVICERCGDVTAFEDDALERALRRLAKRVSYEVNGHDVVLRGKCPACAEGG